MDNHGIVPMGVGVDMREEEPNRLRSLASMARVLNRPHPLPRLLELAAEEACRALPAASVSVSRAEHEGDSVRTILNVGDLGPDEVRWPENEIYPMPEFATVDASGDVLVVWRFSIDDPDTPEEERALLKRLGKASSAAAPLVVDGKVWGEVYATRRHAEPLFDDDDVAYLEGLLAILAGALSRADRERSLSELAYRDPLTGLLNRRAIDEHAQRVFDVPAGRTREVGVVAVDINGLKQTNDRFGHQAGDRLIQSVARRLQRAFAPVAGSIVARVGGDEFTVLLVDCPLEQVVEVSDQLSAESWELDPTTALSCGVAGTVLDAQHTLTPAELFAAADRAQYIAKRELRRTTVVAPLIRSETPE
jgi:diguanylate cyclase (GGDEF)-like protein